MNWNSKEGRALLWRAYPEGYLAMRGVLTVGGWTYAGETAHPNPHYNSTIWARPGRFAADGTLLDRCVPMSRSVPRQNMGPPCNVAAGGDFLPLPDPADHATWACLLADLAEASEACSAGEMGLALVQDIAGWDLRSQWSKCLVGWSIDTDDPAEALVLARARLHVETD